MQMSYSSIPVDTKPKGQARMSSIFGKGLIIRRTLEVQRMQNEHSRALSLSYSFGKWEPQCMSKGDGPVCD